MKKLITILLFVLLASELVAAKVFYYADEIDRRNNVAYALRHPFDGIDPDSVSDFDKYACVSLDDYNHFAEADHYDSYDPVSARTASRNDLKRLRREDQLRLINEDPYDDLDHNDIDDYKDWNCYTLRDYNRKAREDSFDNRGVVDFTDFNHMQEVRKIGRYRYNDFYVVPDDFARFNLQHATRRAPYYEPYEFRRSRYPLYGFGVRRHEDY